VRTYLKEAALLVHQGAEGCQCHVCGSRLPLECHWLAAGWSLGTSVSSSVVALLARGRGEVAHVPHTCHGISGRGGGRPVGGLRRG